MFEIQLKFYNRYWGDFCDGKRYPFQKAIELFTNLIRSYPDSQWRLVYNEKKEKDNRKELKS